MYLGDSLEVIPRLDVRAELLLTDPPYGRVLSDDWDNIDRSSLLSLIDDTMAAALPKLAANGTLYVFCWPQVSDLVASTMRRRVNVLSNIVWLKRERLNEVARGMMRRARIVRMRSPGSETERIIMAEPWGADGAYSTRDAQAFAGVMRPLIDYFQQAFAASGLSHKALQDAMHRLTGVRYTFDRHALAVSQWEFPTRDQYTAAQTVMPALRRDYEALLRDYEALRRDYEALRRDYEALRRYYQPTAHNYTDVLVCPPIAAGRRDRVHPAQKPIELLRDMIETSCPPGGLVLDPFAGSGATAIAARQCGRRCILIERDEKIAEKAAERLDADNIRR
ncbi:MAG: site-specific DNA-methyltransferase [Victivallaceae bacterium]|nr:site-specific DNA-methyltransferase [Victivallaceae bacterium]